MRKFLFIILSLFLVLSIFSCNSEPIKHTDTSADSTDNIPSDDKPADDNPTDVPSTDDTSTKYNVVLKIYDKDSSNYIEKQTVKINKLNDIRDVIKVDDVIIGGTKYSFYGWADVSLSNEIIEEFQQERIDENTSLTSDKTLCAIYQGDYLTFEAVKNTTISFDCKKIGIGLNYNIQFPNYISLQYRIEGEREFKSYKWTIKGNSSTYAYSSTLSDDYMGYEGDKIKLSSGQKVYFKGLNSTFSTTDTDMYQNVYGSEERSGYVGLYMIFKSTGSVKASGNIMSIMKDPISVPENCFMYFFRDCTTLLTAPELPATILAKNCYKTMFYGCTSLTEAPELPADTLTEGCYSNMFKNCTSLTEAPKLSVTTLSEYCYHRMFEGCTSLTEAPELPATTLAAKCYYEMFLGCVSLTEAPELPATTLADGCYLHMFEDCSSLVTAPSILPATTLIEQCYSAMFSGCTSLIKAPELPATTLTNKCYEAMFSGCSSLTIPPELPATTLAYSCYYFMFSRCISLVTAPELPATTLANNCYETMFANCTSLKKAPELPATTMRGNCYYRMFLNCTSLTEAPELPTTTLVSECYKEMFSGCSSLTEIKCSATILSGVSSTRDWALNVAPTGTFKCKAGVNWTKDSSSGIPKGWTVEYV